MPDRDEHPEPEILPLIVERRADEAPDTPLIIAAEGTVTCSALNARANRIARMLRDNGLSRSGSCAVMMANSADAIATWIAIAKLAAVEVPINSAYRGEILRHVLATAGCTMIVADAGFLPVLAEVAGKCPELRLCICRGTAPDDVSVSSTLAILPFEAGLSPDGTNLGDPPGLADTACILFTSGTTGPSKGAIIPHRQMIAFGETYRLITAMTPADVTYNYLPFFHVAGKFNFMAPLIAGGRMVLRERLAVSGFWDDIRRHRCTVVTAVGGVCNMLHARPEAPDDADNPLRLIYAVPIPREIAPAFTRRFGLTMVEGYGSTECNIVVWTPPAGAPHGACGRPGPWYEVAVVDTLDRPLPPGEAGEIVVRGRGPWLLTQGYFGMPAETCAAFRNQWFHTGDRGRMDAAGWLWFIDRMKDTLRRRGENISSYEVEQIVLRHPGIAEAAAVAVPSDLQEDEMKLVVVRRAGVDLTEDALLRWCVAELPYFMVPRFIEFREDLPRTPTQKIRKVDLRAEGIGPAAWDREEAGWRLVRGRLERAEDQAAP